MRQMRGEAEKRRAAMTRGALAVLGCGALPILGVGCAEGGVTGLGETFDPAATVALLESVSGAAEENVSAVHASLGGAVLTEAAAPEASAARRSGGQLLGRAVRGSAVEGRADAPTFGSVVRAPVLSLHASRATGSADALGALVPDTLKGRTFGLEGGIGGYHVVPEATDAPADGVRFRTYELDPVTARPRRIPLNREGHLDIREGTPGAFPRLELQGVRRDGRTDLDLYLEGTVSFGETEVTSDLESAGTILGDDDAVEFSLSERVAFTDGFNRLEIVFSRQIAVPAKDRSVALEWQGIAAAGDQGVTSSLSFVLTIVDGSHTALVDVTATDTSVTGSVLYDGATAAVISGDPFAPTLSRPDGSPFSATEHDAVLDLLDGPDAALEFGDEMLSALAVLFET